MAEISGRGMQALLLDNQAEAVDFGQATLSEILRRYVTPYGIELREGERLPSVWGFSVSSGSSCWRVLYEFARYYAGVTPRFDREGKLLLSAWKNETPLLLDEKVPVTGLSYREKRYGVLSQVVVKDTRGWNRQVEVNQDFLAQGGCCSRVMLLPKNTGFQARRYSARFQLDRSEAERSRVEVVIALPFAAWPGQLVELRRGDWGKNGVFRVLQSKVTLEDGGIQTALTLGDPQAVL